MSIEIVAFYKRISFGMNKPQNNTESAVNSSYFSIGLTVTIRLKNYLLLFNQLIFCTLLLGSKRLKTSKSNASRER